MTTLLIEPGPPRRSGYSESFNGELADGLLGRGLFDTPPEAAVLIARRRLGYNRFRPHGGLGSRPPAPEAIAPRAPEFGRCPLTGAAVASLPGAL